MIALVKNTQNLTKGGFRFLPVLDYTRKWNDQSLYKYFGIDEGEQKFQKLLRWLAEFTGIQNEGGLF